MGIKWIAPLIELANRITGWIPVQSRAERVKNQIATLQRKRDALLDEAVTSDKAATLKHLDRQLAVLYGRLLNH